MTKRYIIETKHATGLGNDVKAIMRSFQDDPYGTLLLINSKGYMISMKGKMLFNLFTHEGGLTPQFDTSFDINTPPVAAYNPDLLDLEYIKGDKPTPIAKPLKNKKLRKLFIKDTNPFKEPNKGRKDELKKAN